MKGEFRFHFLLWTNPANVARVDATIGRLKQDFILERWLGPMVAALVVAFAVCFLASCSQSPTAKPFTVGSTPSTEQVILAEIASQLLEKQLGMTIVRKVDVASTSIGYDALIMSEIDLYPEDTNAIMTAVLKEPVDPNPEIVMERVRGEMARLGKIQMLNPLGIRRHRIVSIKSSDARDGNLKTLSDAARSRLAWTLGETSEFHSSTDGHSALMSAYPLPLKIAPKVIAPGLIYSALAENQVSMASGFETDGALLTGQFTALKDDKGAFRDNRTSFFIREDSLSRYPKIRATLEQLSGKFTNESIQKMNHEVDALRHQVRSVASEFLRQAGL